MTPAGIEPATFRFVAQHLNHWCYRGPRKDFKIGNIPMTPAGIFFKILSLTLVFWFTLALTHRGSLPFNKTMIVLCLSLVNKLMLHQ